MSEIVHVHHPAPLWHVPTGSRVPRLGFAALSTPVRLNEVSAGELAHVTTCEGVGNHAELDVFAHGGRLWTPLRRNEHERGPDGKVWMTNDIVRRPVPRQHFLRRLKDGQAGEASWLPAFARTPLYAQLGPGFTRGDAGLAEDAGRIIADGRGRARDDLVRFMDGNILLAEDQVLVRCPGPVAAARPLQNDVVVSALVEPRGWLFLEGRDSLFVRLDRYPDLRDLVAGLAVAPRRWGQEARLMLDEGSRFASNVVRLVADLQPSLRGLDPAYFGDDDLLLAANDFARRAWDILDRRLRAQEDRASDEHGRLTQMMDAILPWDVLGRLGAIRREEAEEALVLFRDVLSQVRDLVPRQDARRIMAWVPYIDELLLPRLRPDVGLAEDDADALSDLTPGGPR